MRDLEMPTIIEKENNLIDPSKINPLDDRDINSFMKKLVGKEAPILAVKPAMEDAYERLEKYSTGDYEFLGLGSVRNPLIEDNSLFLANLLFFNTDRLPLEIREKASEVIAVQLINSRSPLQAVGIYEDDLGVSSLQDSLAAFDDKDFADLKESITSPIHHPLMQQAFGSDILEKAEEKMNVELDRMREDDLRSEAQLLTENMVLFSNFMHLVNLSEDRNETTLQLIKSELSNALNDQVDELVKDISRYPEMPAPLLRGLRDEINRYVANFTLSSSKFIDHVEKDKDGNIIPLINLISPSPEMVAEKFANNPAFANYDGLQENMDSLGVSAKELNSSLRELKSPGFYDKLATEFLHRIQNISTAEFLIKSIPSELEGLLDRFVNDFKIPRDDEGIPSDELEHQSFMCSSLLSTIEKLEQNELFQDDSNAILGLYNYIPSLESIKTTLDYYNNGLDKPENQIFPA